MRYVLPCAALVLSYAGFACAQERLATGKIRSGLERRAKLVLDGDGGVAVIAGMLLYASSLAILSTILDAARAGK